jgi:t-SNARE complex subunit (syntaxin)
MNDKIKDLLSTAYKTDSIEKNKWRIENREQLREQRKKELKELMEKDKTMSNNKQSSVDWLIEQLKEYDFSEEDDTYVIKIQSWVLTEKHEQAKAMHRREHADTARDWWVEGASDARKAHTEKYESFDDYYTEKFTAEQPA